MYLILLRFLLTIFKDHMLLNRTLKKEEKEIAQKKYVYLALVSFSYYESVSFHFKLPLSSTRGRTPVGLL